MQQQPRSPCTTSTSNSAPTREVVDEWAEADGEVDKGTNDEQHKALPRALGHQVVVLGRGGGGGENSNIIHTHKYTRKLGMLPCAQLSTDIVLNHTQHIHIHTHPGMSWCAYARTDAEPEYHTTPSQTQGYTDAPTHLDELRPVHAKHSCQGSKDSS